MLTGRHRVRLKQSYKLEIWIEWFNIICKYIPTNNFVLNNRMTDGYNRNSSQFQLPQRLQSMAEASAHYSVFPVSHLESGTIFNGYDSLSEWIMQFNEIRIDGYEGIFWNEIQSGLQACLEKKGLKVHWIETVHFLKPEVEIDALIMPFLGTPDSIWGSICQLDLADLFQMDLLNSVSPDQAADLTIVIGIAAALTSLKGPLIYLDLPKNEVQYRMRAGAMVNLGSARPGRPSQMYKRFYFVDWILLNAHKKRILSQISIIADGQWKGNLNWMLHKELVYALEKLSHSPIRVRPWFEPGAWGGQWIKEHIPELNSEVINYAWSFEWIVPENGLVFESDGFLLEVSFDFLMFQNNEKILGKHAALYGDEFPLRFDFLDTMKGGNLSIQCHPGLRYIKEIFGEQITQDETYYILDCAEHAVVYLGFQESINSGQFRDTLIVSQATGTEVEISKFVQSHASKKHDLFLIPNKTVHSAGAGNMVLEISATPYIFTFKMYDWLRLDLEGNLRPLNIEHAFKNLDFERKGDRVRDELLSRPVTLDQGEDWKLIHLPTHAEHFYDVHRFDFITTLKVDLNNCFHLMMLVEGEAILVETEDGSAQVYSYTETFMIPAAARSYKVTNKGKSPVKLIKAFLK